jgi:hypothetical protein
MLPVAPWYSAVTAVMPALTPTTTPVELTVAVSALPVLHATPDRVPMSCFVPSGSVAIADICNESARPTAQGEGEIAIAEIVSDEVEEPQATSASSRRLLASRVEVAFMVAFS